MKKFIRSISVATLAMAMAIPAMADRVLNADVVVVGAGAGGGVVIQCGVPGAVSSGNPDAAAGVFGFSGTHGEGGSCSRGCE